MDDTGLRDASPPLDARSLRESLSRPTQVLPFGLLRPPGDELIEMARASPDPVSTTASLARAAAVLLAECEAEIRPGRDGLAALPFAASLGFVCATLELDIDGTPFSRIGRRLLDAEQRNGDAHAMDLFQVLRTAGRYEARRLPPEGERIPWDDLLRDPNRGIRTLAAQVIVRLAPGSAMSRLPDLFEADVNDGLLANELLVALGLGSVIDAAPLLDARTASRLSAGLSDCGHHGPAMEVKGRNADPDARREGAP